jgi:hypothetical protein
MQPSTLLTRHPLSADRESARAPGDAKRTAQTVPADDIVLDVTASVKRKIPLVVTGAALMLVVVSALVWHFAL